MRGRSVLTPQWDLSYLWLIQNCVLPPLPSVWRCYEFGRMVGEAVRTWESPRRVALLGTGAVATAAAPNMLFSAVGGAATVAVLIIYARLLGRLMWVAAQRDAKYGN